MSVASRERERQRAARYESTSRDDRIKCREIHKCHLKRAEKFRIGLDDVIPELMLPLMAMAAKGMRRK